MATKNIVPRANNEGQLGTSDKKWNNICVDNINGLSSISYSKSDYTKLELVSTNALYIDDSGSDTIGEGTIGNPWYSLTQAFRYLRNKYIPHDMILTINIGTGNYSWGPTNLFHPCGERIKIIGAGKTSTIINFSGGDYSYGYCFSLFNGCLHTISDMKLIGTSNSSYTAIGVDAVSVLKFIKSVHMDTTNTGILCTQGSIIGEISNSCQITNVGGNGILVQLNSKINEMSDVNITGIGSTNGVMVRFRSKINYLSGGILTSLGNAISAKWGSTIGIDNSSLPTFVSCSTNYTPSYNSSSTSDYTFANGGSCIQDYH